MNTSVVLVRTQSLVTDRISIHDIPVINQNNEEQCHTSAIHRLIRKLDRRLLPFIALLEISSFVNRVSIGHSKLMGIQTDLHMSDSEYTHVISIFYIAHFLFDIPSYFLLRFIGLTRYLSLSMLVWGSITVGMAFVTNARQIIILRFFLGVAQAGYFSGIIIYFSLWYCKRDQTMKIAILYSAAIFSRALAGILACIMEKMQGIGGLKSWRWLFLLEGLPLIPLGLITYFFLDNVPNAVQWLNNIEKQMLTNLLRNDVNINERNPTLTNRFSWRQIFYIFIDWRIYLYGIIAIGNESVILCLTTFFSTFMYNTGYSRTEAYLITVPSYIVTCIFCLLVNYSSSRRNEHGYHVIFCLLIGLFGFVLMLTLFDKSKLAVPISITLTCCGILSAFPLLLSWLTINFDGYTERAMAISFVIGIAQIGGIVSPLIYRDIDKPIYRRGHLICGGMTIASLILTIILHICLRREKNHRRTSLSSEE